MKSPRERVTLSTATQKSLDRKKYMKYVRFCLGRGRGDGRRHWEQGNDGFGVTAALQAGRNE